MISARGTDSASADEPGIDVRAPLLRVARQTPRPLHQVSASFGGGEQPRCRHFSARFHRKDKYLAGLNTIWISDLVSVRFVNDRVSRTRAVAETTHAPRAVATGYNRGRHLRLDHGGR
jgi:hypothetical protein